MDLTSWNRLRHVLGTEIVLDDSLANRNRYMSWIPVISNRVTNFLDREIELTTHTEYHDSEVGRLEYWIRGYPISSITSVKSDTTGLFTGSETDESNYYIGQDSNSIVLDLPITPTKRGLEFVYIGGLANHGTQSVFVISGAGSEPFAAGVYAEGQTSKALGIVVSLSGTTLTIEVLYGVFQSGEEIKGKTTWDGTSYTANQEATIASVTSRSLAESYPDIVMATELELRYMESHRSDYENESTLKGQTSRKDMTKDYNLVPEVRGILQPYRKMTI
jgi:hypothetical protein